MLAELQVPDAPALSPEAEAFVAAVGAATDLPAFVRNVRAISTVAGNLDARIAQLEQAIVQDVALSAKVLRIANSVSVGAVGGGAPAVGSVKQAIMLLGYDRVQHLSTAASVFEQIDQDAPSVRDLLVESVLAANHGLQLAVAAGYAKPELAYLCALFRRLGEVLVACYRARQYRSWQQRVAEQGPRPDGAESSHFGFTFEEVGVALARKWSMPPDVVRTMHTCRQPSSTTELLHAITQCSADVARCLYGGAPSTVDVTELRSRYASVIGVDSESLEESMTLAVAESKPTLQSMQVQLDEWVARRDAAQRAARPESDPARGAHEAQVREELVVARADDSAAEARLREAVRDLLQASPAGPAAPDVGSVTNSTLSAACDAGFERGVLAISTEDFKLIRGRLGIGRGGTELARHFTLRPTPNFGPLGTALHNRTDLFVVMQGADAKHYGRDRLIRELEPAQFALLPLVLDGKLLGCLYFDSTREEVIGTVMAQQLLSALRDQLVAAFARRRYTAAAQGAPAAVA